MEFELARESDKSPIKQLLAECDLPNEDITLLTPQHFLVLRGGVELAGVIGLEILGRFALLRSLAVPLRHREKGIALQLTRKAEEYARSYEIETLYLLTTTAEGFFAKRGYHRVDRNSVPPAIQETAEFRSLCPSSAVCMVKHL